MSGMLEDIEHRIDEAKAKAQQKKAEEKIAEAQRAAEKAKKDSSSLF